MDAVSRWNQVLQNVGEQIGHQDVAIWFSSTTPTVWTPERVLLQVPNQYYADWILENYQGPLEAAFRAVLGHLPTVDFEAADDPTAELPIIDDDCVAPESGLHARYTFASLVVGECNKLAVAAAQAVSDGPARAYNPLTIYGPTGLGKTHLMHAIGNEVAQRHRGARVLYVTAEAFMNEMIDSLRDKRMDDFRAKYRQRASVLLVDDIQFLSGKDRTQEEFFHTFNALVSSGRQIVLSCDVEPAAIDKLEPRLRTRFQGGLPVDVQPPDRETLLAILHKKAGAMGVTVPTDVADRIATRGRGNVREVEGLLNKWTALRALHAPPEAGVRFLADAEANPGLVPVSVVIQAVARTHGVRSADITGPKRNRMMTRARHLAMYLARRHCGVSFPELGREFGRDHSTVQHGVAKVESDLKVDDDLATRVRVLEQQILARR